MKSLDKELRTLLERTTLKARAIAEEAAQLAVERLAVKEKEAYPFMDETQRSFRRALRALGRAKGDLRQNDTTQQTSHLISYVAYEHWHRMLFSRFLAENNLLTTEGVSVTLEECEQLAAEGEEGASDGFELACIYATQQLPQIFRQDDPANQLSFDNTRHQQLRTLLAELPAIIFTVDDALGWVYQFWQTTAKKEANEAEEKINADTLPAVTQLFTEPYMVSFLIDNTLGAWWLNNPREHATPAHAPTSADFPYLRDPSSTEGEAELGPMDFSGWPATVAELQILDPSMGSGHFLVTLLPLLARMHMAERGLTKGDAVRAVLSENLHGLEIDPRCAEIAAFALALAAWKFAPELAQADLPPLSLACCGLRIKDKKESFVAMVAPEHAYLMEQLYDLFYQAPELGSLINPERQLFELADAEHFTALLPAIEAMLQEDRTLGKFEESESGVTARGLAEAYRLLRKQYHLVITNVPYLARGKQGEVMKAHVEKYYKDGKADLATAFTQRCLEFCTMGGTTTLVTPQNWLFLSSYKHLRKDLLEEQSFDWIARLGAKGFQTPMWDFNVMLFSLTRQKPNEQTHYWGVDVSADKSPAAKAVNLRSSDIKYIPQVKQLTNPDYGITLETENVTNRLGLYANSLAGLDNGDTLQFRFFWWEIPYIDTVWVFQVNSAKNTELFTGRERILRWENGKGKLTACPGARISNIDMWDQKGLYVSRMGDLPSTLCLRSAWDRNGAFIIPKKEGDLLALWAFASSESFSPEVRKINQKLSVAESAFEKVPFDLEHWQKVAEENYPNGLPAPYSNDPTQWLYKGRIDDTAEEHVLHVATARLLGYRWPAELDAEKAGVEVLPEDEAHWKQCAAHVDDDGIVCLPTINREKLCAERLRSLLSETLTQYDERALIAATGSKKSTLEDWLQEDFFTQHCKLFHHRPFIWHLWDGRPDGFHALVNYHMLDYKNLEKLTYTYLGDWIREQERAAAEGVPGADERLGAAQNLHTTLQRILEGEAPYDLFIRWKTLEEQPSGWHPDLNDGIRLNIRPFMTQDLPSEHGAKGKKGAGILRTKPNIKWGKDRGKDPTSAPWFPTFNGDRINDHHLTLEEKSNKE